MIKFSKTAPNQEQQNKDIVLAFTNAFNNRNMSAIDKLVAVNSIDHQALGLQGREGVKMFFKSVYTAFPDFHTTIDRMVSGGNKVAGVSSSL